jgi:hypothetical protein
MELTHGQERSEPNDLSLSPAWSQPDREEIEWPT